MTRVAITAWMTAIILILTAPSAVLAQAVNNAQIHGVVQDSTGAVVSGAQIKATQIDTGQVLSTVSGSDGSYVLPGLPVGSTRSR